ncbi:DUF2946 domain-containing protein [Pseudomonas fluorescens]|uniref:DUF2946 domain-containing protein n=1 Tax=Pseudomonas fluorescens TaxID=294 RepID=A0A5E7DVL1_PSEFL|nr:DUF2946 domain-containing protein [Pseudomonas fluorescens]VVO21597.1 hypothetical protein PS691_04230 [Pseudomonas fluorescens]
MNTLRSPSVRQSEPRHRSLRVKRGSWISLFAMLMIFIGPLISQAMPMDHGMPMNMSMNMCIDEPGCHAASQHHSKPASAEQQMLWEKCGYCGLLYNCPALPGGLSFAASDTPPTSSVISPSPRLGHARQTVFPGARTRAPPIVR